MTKGKFILRIGRTTEQSSVYWNGQRVPNLQSASFGIDKNNGSLPILKLEIAITPGMLEIEHDDLSLIAHAENLLSLYDKLNASAKQMFQNMDREI